VMRMRDAPLVETWTVPSDLPPFGVGEQPVPPIYAAVANAVFAATGKRLRELPIQAQAAELRQDLPP
jgi:isoquinoline 1-oxidoreductase subunit beta